MKRTHIHVTLPPYKGSNEGRVYKIPVYKDEQRPFLTCAVNGSYNRIRRAIRFFNQHAYVSILDMEVYRSPNERCYFLYILPRHGDEKDRQAYCSGIWRGACKFKRSFRNQPTT